MAGRYAANRYGGYIPVSTDSSGSGGGDGTFVKKIYIEKKVEIPLPTIRMAKAIETSKDTKPKITITKIEEGDKIR
jgi:hypothetical protein